MTVPTPVSWSTWTAMQRWLAGHWMLVIWPPWLAPTVAEVIWAPDPHRLAGDLPDDLRGIPEGAHGDRREVHLLGRHLVGLDARRQRDIGRCDDDGPGRLWPGGRITARRVLRQEQDAHKGDDRQKDTDKHDEPIGTLQVGTPRGG